MRRLMSAAVISALLISIPTFRALSDDAPPQAGFDSSWTASRNGALVIRAQKEQLGPSSSVPTDRQPSSAPEQKHEPCRTDDTPLSRSCGMYAVRVTKESGRPLTIADLAQFAPPPVTTTAEPGNAGIAGMPTNFVATVAAHTATGTLLDRPVTVRFTPVRVVFDHGDGTTATKPDGGSTWSTLGQAPFTPTETSHTYARRGTYSTRTTVAYTAEVDIGGGWFPVSGELSVDGPSRSVRIYEATTALVARTCEERPAAPGC